VRSCAVISDIHGNRLALEAVLEDIAGRPEIDATYCLGDLVGYGPDPNGVIDLIREAGIPTLLGNYDDGVGRETGDCGCYYATPEAERLGAASYAFTAAAVTPEGKAFLRRLPGDLRIELGALRAHLVHGSPRKINEYLMSDRDERTFLRIARAETDGALVFGHTHQQWHRTYGGVLFVAAGSAGRPKDGDPRAMYTVLHAGGAPPSEAPGEDAGAGPAGSPPLEVDAIRVAYDVEATARAMVAAGLPTELAESFRRGA
jgi:predicted phosphodiesterase